MLCSPQGSEHITVFVTQGGFSFNQKKTAASSAMAALGYDVEKRLKSNLNLYQTAKRLLLYEEYDHAKKYMKDGLVGSLTRWKAIWIYIAE